MLIRLVIAALVSGLMASVGQAGEQYVDASGFAVSGYDVVAYFDLPQSEVGQAQAKAVPGRAALTAEYDGARFAFSTAANLQRFLANPAKYAPQYDGHCAYGVALGNKVPANPDLWRIVDGKLYLNITQAVARTWESDIAGFVQQAESKWPGQLETLPASRDAVPQFTSVAPLAS